MSRVENLAPESDSIPQKVGTVTDINSISNYDSSGSDFSASYGYSAARNNYSFNRSMGRIRYVGSGPGDPGLLTRNAHEIIITSKHVVIDPEIPQSIIQLIGSDIEEESDNETKLHTGSGALSNSLGLTHLLPKPKNKSNEHQTDLEEIVDDSDELSAKDVTVAAHVESTCSSPEETAYKILSLAKTGVDIVRLVWSDPLTSNHILEEMKIINNSGLEYEIIPGLPTTTIVPGYAGMPLGSSHISADVRSVEDINKIDWKALAKSNFPVVLTVTNQTLSEIALQLISQEVQGSTSVALTTGGTTRQQKTVEATLSNMHTVGANLVGNIVLTITNISGLNDQQSLNWWESRALFGWNVLVPRTKEQSKDMSLRLKEHGAIPKEVPTISVEPPRSAAQMERAIKGLVDGRYEWIVFTSTNAVKAVWEKFVEFGLDARAFSGVKIACVGQSTAQKVRGLGIEPELVPTGEQSSKGLLDEFPKFDEFFDPVNRILLPRADIATETLAAGLVEMGWEIEDVTAYRTVRAAPPPAHIREMIKTGGFDAVCFTSSSTVRNLVGIAGKPHARTIIACIGPQTAATATEYGLRVDVQPETANILDLVDALASHASKLRAEGTLPPPRKKSRKRSQANEETNQVS